MTRWEIINNIRYNENLVNSYQREITSLRNTINNSNGQIYRCNSEIGNIRARNRDLVANVSALNQLKSKYQNLYNSFSNRQTSRINKLYYKLNCNYNVNCIEVYKKGMNNLLEGNEYRHTLQTIRNAIDSIEYRIKHEQNEINMNENEIRSKEGNTENLRRNINLCQRKIDNVNKLLNYRRQRIIYWKNQLR